MKPILYYKYLDMLLILFIYSAWFFYFWILRFMGIQLLTYYSKYIKSYRVSYVGGQCHGNNINFKVLNKKCNSNKVF